MIRHLAAIGLAACLAAPAPVRHVVPTANGFRAVSQDQPDVVLAWDAAPDTATAITRGYIVGVGLESGNYTQFFNVGLVTQATVRPIATNTALYFLSVLAYNEQGERSDPSNEVSLELQGSSGPPPAAPGAPSLRTVTFTSDPVAGTSTAVLTWDPQGVAVSGYKMFAGQGSRTYSATKDVGLATTGTITVATPATATTFYFAVTSYIVATPFQESGFSNELTTVIPVSGPPPPPPPVDECAPPFGKFVVTATITRYVAENQNAPGSTSRLEYLTQSANSPITSVRVLANGNGIRSMGDLIADVTAASGIRFYVPTIPGSYTIALEAINAAKCKAVQTRDVTGRPIIVVVK